MYRSGTRRKPLLPRPDLVYALLIKPPNDMRIRPLLALAALVLLGGAALAQDAAPAPSPAAKKPRVITNDDLDALPGGVSVVGAHDSWKETEKPADAEKPPSPGETRAAGKPKEPCPSRAFADAVTVVLREEGIGWRSPFWMDRIFGSDICTLKLNNIDALARRVDGDYTLPTGQKLRIASRTTGLPPSEELVLNTKAGKHYVMIWKGTPYVTTSVRYLEQQVSDGAGVGKAGVIVSGIDLYDPYNERNTLFSVREGNSPQEIDAVVLFTVTPRP